MKLVAIKTSANNIVRSVGGHSTNGLKMSTKKKKKVLPKVKMQVKGKYFPEKRTHAVRESLMTDKTK